MKLIKITITTFICLLCITDLIAGTFTPATKQHYFLTYDGRNGLSHNTVNKIIQDRLGFMWFGTKNGLNRFDGAFFKVFNKENSSLGNNSITDIYENKDGDLWIGTDKGLFIFNPVMETFTPIKEYARTDKAISHTVTHITADNRNNIYFSVDQEGLYRYDDRTHRLTQPMKFHSRKQPSSNISSFIVSNNTCWVAFYNDNLYYSTDNLKTIRPYKDKNGKMPFYKVVINNILQNGNDIYLCTSEGLYILNARENTCRKLFDGYVRTVEFNGTELWAGTEKGLWIYTYSTGTINKITAADDNDPYALTDNAIYTLCKDREGGIWIGSYFGGVNYYSIRQNYFEKYYPHSGMTFMGRRVRNFCKSNDGTIWVGTEDKGLFNFNPRTKQLMPFHNPLIYSNIHGLCLDGDNLWIGTFSGGLNRMNLRSGQVKNYRQGDAPNTLSSDNIFSLYVSRNKELWIGTVSGLLTYNRATDDFRRISYLKEYFIDNILEDRNGNMWFGTYANGLFSYNPQNNKWHHYTNKPDDSTSISSNKIINSFQDSKGRLWFMTQDEGLCLLNPATGTFRRYDMTTGLPSNIVYKMVEDKAGQLWLSTGNGLVCLTPDLKHMEVYTTADGLLSNQFNYQAGLWNADDGTIYMGSINGFIIFNPEVLTQTPRHSTVYFTDLYVFDKPVTVGGKDSPLKKSLPYSDEITLTADQNSIALEVSDLDFGSSEKGNLQYKLEGFDREWHRINSDGVIYYSNLPYRNFTLQIRSIDSEDNPTEIKRSLKIRVLPPFYLTGWAISFYLLLVIAGIAYCVHRMKARIRNKQKQAMQAFENKKERELYNSKITFFTNITHEIRTPLTLIKGPLEDIQAKFRNIPDEIKDDLKIMDSNTNRLLDLVNQLLDFRKKETNGLKLNFVKTDAGQLLKKICESFRPTLTGRQLSYDIDIPESIEAVVDTEAFTKILTNLLSNAMKHAESYIKLKASTHDGQLTITVENDGDIIPMEMREDIFKPFVQYKDTKQNVGPGTGLGLTLARSLAELHHGTLKMDLAEDVNRFILTLPLEQTTGFITLNDRKEEKQYEEENTDSTTPDLPSVNNITDGKKYTLLIVEDNNDMREFIAGTLRPLYSVRTAKDGLKALEVLKKEVINLIISDIMMPNMDGITLCNRIKTTLEYSHIPVILLTAKTALSSKIEGTRQGADAYIEKPFSIEYLKAETANLLNSREKLRQLFTKSPFTQTDSVSVSKIDNEFLQDLHKAVTDNLSNSEFTVDELASLLNMSKSSFSRKFRGLLDITPNDYIRLERLKQAAVMLKKGNAPINEVCYSCGFNTPSYFAKCFYKQFGVLPKDFVQQNMKQTEN